jgi:hypothetical protein
MRLVASIIVITVIGFWLWLNYGWLCNSQPWKPEVVPFPPFGYIWERESLHLSSPAAEDCGRLKVNESPNNATECGLKAFRNSQPFRVRYDWVGTDTHIAAGLIYTPQRELYGLTLHDDGIDGSTQTSPEWIETILCPSPFQLHVTPNSRLTCFSKEMKPPNIMADL